MGVSVVDTSIPRAEDRAPIFQSAPIQRDGDCPEAVGVASVTPSSLHPSFQNRFAAIAEEEEQVEVHAMSEGSDTESCRRTQERNEDGVRRRLQLTWDDFADPTVQAAQALVNNLVQRIGPVSPGGVLPRGLRQQRWSPMKVPLMWAAASDRESDPVLQWLGDMASRIQEPASFHGGECSAREGVRLGFSSLRDVMRGWGIESPEGLSQWLRQHGFPATRPGNHIPARGQEHILALGCTVDARIALLEAVYVMITVDQSRTAGVPNPPTVEVRRRPFGKGCRPCCLKGHGSSWTKWMLRRLV